MQRSWMVFTFLRRFLGGPLPLVGSRSPAPEGAAETPAESEGEAAGEPETAEG